MVPVARRARPEPVRDLFEAPTTWVPPKEFTDYLAERRAGAVRVVPTRDAAPELDPEPAPEIEDGHESPVLAPAAPPPPEPAPTTRNFTTALERVQSGDLLVIRERVEHGHHRYRAFERSKTYFHEETIDELTWGRIDTRRLRNLDPYGPERVELLMKYSAEAHDAIRQLCPETRRHPSDSGIFMFDGPGYVLLTVDPEARYLAARAREVPA